MNTPLYADKKFQEKFTHNDANAVKAAIAELDGNISNINSLNLWIPKNAVATKAALVTTYAAPAKNWAAMSLEDGYIYVNDGLGALEANWVNSGQKAFPVDFINSKNLISNVSELNDIITTLNYPAYDSTYPLAMFPIIKTFYTNSECKWNPYVENLNNISVISNAIAKITLSFCKIVDSKSIEIWSQYVDVVVGTNVVDFTDINFDFSKIDSDIFIFINAGVTQVIKYSGIAGHHVYFFNSDNNDVVDDTDYIISLKINKSVGYPILAAIESQRKRLDELQSVSNSFDLAVEIAKGRTNIIIPDGEWDVASTINIPSGVIIKGNSQKSILKAGSACTCVLSMANVNDIVLSNFKIKGLGSSINISATDKVNSLSNIVYLNTIGSNNGIYIENCKNIQIDGLSIYNFDGSGIDAMIIGPSYQYGSKFSNLNINDCHVGVRFRNGAEYSSFYNSNINNCLIGIHIASGNMMFSNVSSTSNRVNLYIGAGANDAHGTMVGCLFNHATYRSIQIFEITNGFTFSGCHVFGSVINIENSKGFNFNGGIIDAEIQVNGGGDIKSNAFINNAFKSDSGGGTITITDNTKTILKNNFMIDGSVNSVINN